MIDPSAIPLPKADPDAVEDAGRALRKDGNTIAQTGDDIHSAWQGLDEFYTAPHEGRLGVTVALEADVRVAADGAVRLVSSGWPEADAPVPVYRADRSDRELLGEALGRPRGAAPFDEAMLMVCLAGSATRDPAAEEAARGEVAEAASARRAGLAGYVAATEAYALGVRADGRFGACLYRSALEFLFERHLGSAAFSLVDMEDVEDIDGELRDALPDTPLLAPEAVPRGVPVHHWWWTLSG